MKEARAAKSATPVKAEDIIGEGPDANTLEATSTDTALVAPAFFDATSEGTIDTALVATSVTSFGAKNSNGERANTLNANPSPTESGSRRGIVSGVGSSDSGDSALDPSVRI